MLLLVVDEVPLIGAGVDVHARGSRFYAVQSRLPDLVGRVRLARVLRPLDRLPRHVAGDADYVWDLPFGLIVEVGAVGAEHRPVGNGGRESWRQVLVFVVHSRSLLIRSRAHRLRSLRAASRSPLDRISTRSYVSQHRLRTLRLPIRARWQDLLVRQEPGRLPSGVSSEEVGHRVPREARTSTATNHSGGYNAQTSQHKTQTVGRHPSCPATDRRGWSRSMWRRRRDDDYRRFHPDHGLCHHDRTHHSLERAAARRLPPAQPLGPPPARRTRSASLRTRPAT